MLNKNIKIIGHRGAAGIVLENTMAGFVKAAEMGVKIIEIDVWEISSGEIIVFHDAYLDRLTHKSGFTTQLNTQSLKETKLKNGDPIPELSEVVAFAKEKGIKLIVEMKNELATQKTYDFLRKNIGYDQFSLGSFFHEPIFELKKHDSKLDTSIMFENVPVNLADYLSLVNPNNVVISIETFNQKLIDVVKQQSRNLIFYTVNIESEISLANSADPYAIITNFPDRFDISA